MYNLINIKCSRCGMENSFVFHYILRENNKSVWFESCLKQIDGCLCVNDGHVVYSPQGYFLVFKTTIICA